MQQGFYLEREDGVEVPEDEKVNEEVNEGDTGDPPTEE